MAKLPKRFRRRAGVWSTALLVWDVWRRIPSRQRKQILAQARKHGPRLAKRVVARRRPKR